jgi:hypothetical protein
MNMVVVILIALSTVPIILITRYLTNLRKRVNNAEESTQRLRVRLEASLKAEERTRRDLEEKLYKAEEEYKRIEKELEQKAGEEKQRLIEQEKREKNEKERIDGLDAERLQLEIQLSQAKEERRYLADELQRVREGYENIDEERRKLQDEKQFWQEQIQAYDKELKEITEKLEAQRREFEERILETNHERNFLKDTIRELARHVEEMDQKHAKEEQQWKSEIEARDRNEKEMIEKFDTERQIFEEKLLKADAELRRLEEEIKQKIREEEERRRQQVEEKLRWAEQEKRNKDQLEIMGQLKTERQQLKERLSKADEERTRLQEILKQMEEEGPSRVGEVKHQQLKERLFKSEKKRQYLIKKLRKIAPDVRGGHPRGSVSKADSGYRERVILSLKPEIICWKEGWSWIIGVELSEDLEIQSVTQGGVLLECDIANRNRYPLKQVDSGVEITWSGGRENISLLEPDRNYLIFKMRNNWKEPGRSVRYSTAGYYLIIAPQDWERDTKISGAASVNPESTQVKGFKAHFFYQDKTGINAIGLITIDGERVLVDSKTPRFKLVGNEICDASEDKGPLFGEQPPRIRALNGTKGWSDVGIIVVGDEGGGKNKWRDSFIPNGNEQEQTDLNELINGRSGWYFLRIYDKNNYLIESMDFRFLKNLQDIQIENKKSCLPGPAGHQNILLKFLHHPDCKIELLDKDKQHLLDIRWEDNQTTVNVQPNLESDKTNWILNDGGTEIEATILVERIWWFSGQLEALPSIWTDRPIPLSRKHFNAVTDNALWVRFPRPRFTKKIDVGFDRTKSRSYQVEVEKKETAIPLRDFCDCEEIQNPKQECIFYLFIESEAGSYSAPVLNIITSFHCKNCSFATNSEQEAMSHITFHLNYLIPHLPYDELWQRSGGSLPRKIYKCGYCSFYTSTDDLENPTSKICSHIEHDCKKAKHEHGTAQIYFSVVTNSNEIREKLKLDIPHIYRCQICRKEFRGDDKESMLNHLKTVHKDELFKYF